MELAALAEPAIAEAQAELIVSAAAICRAAEAETVMPSEGGTSGFDGSSARASSSRGSSSMGSRGGGGARSGGGGGRRR